MAQTEKGPRGTRTGKKNGNKWPSKMAEQDSAQIGKKGKRRIRQKWGCREGHTSARPKEDGQPEAFEGIRTKRRKVWEKMEEGLTKTMGTEHALFAKEQNRGTNGSSGRPENSIIKGGDGLWKRQREKKERNTRKEKFSRKNYQKDLCRKKILRKNKYCFPISCKGHYCTYSDPTRIKLCKFWRLK